MAKKVRVNGPLPRMVTLPDVAIGDPVENAVANAVFFADADGKLTQDADGLLVEYATPLNLRLILGALDGSYTDAKATLTAGLSAVNLYASDQDECGLYLDGDGFSVYLLADPTGATLGGATVKLPSLAGTGTRNVVVDANGVLSAP